MTQPERAHSLHSTRQAQQGAQAPREPARSAVLASSAAQGAALASVMVERDLARGCSRGRGADVCADGASDALVHLRIPRA